MASSSKYFSDSPLSSQKLRRTVAAVTTATIISPSPTVRIVPVAGAALVTPPPLHGDSPLQLKRKISLNSKGISAKKGASKAAPRTESFSAIWAGNFPDDESLANIRPHTLILGTHPSITSFERQEYFGHSQNAFWWIAGDCLGFRRASGISSSSSKPYKLASSLRYDNILSYDEQVRCFVRHGFCLWDVVASCQRKGSSDQNIRQEVPNPIRDFCRDHPSLRRIVLANGGTGSKVMIKHFRDWFLSGELEAGPNEESQKVFGKVFARAQKNEASEERKIQVISAISVSPSASTKSYEQKRDFWEEYVYKPGLVDDEQLNR